MLISKNRKLEIVNSRTADAFKQKIGGFNNKSELDLFLIQEPIEAYKAELILTKKKSEKLPLDLRKRNKSNTTKLQ